MSTTRTESRGSWRLQDAKARFSEMVRLAQEAGPQRVTVRGKDAVVVVAGDEFDRLSNPGTGIALVRAMADRRAQELDFEHAKLGPPARDVKLSGDGCSVVSRSWWKLGGAGSDMA